MKIKNYNIEIVEFANVLLIVILSVAPLNYKVAIVLGLFFLLMNISFIMKLRKIEVCVMLLLASMVLAEGLDLINVLRFGGFAYSGVYIIFIFFVSMTVCKRYPYSSYCYYLEIIMLFLSVISLLGFIVLIRAEDIIELMPETTFYGRRVKSILFYNVIWEADGVAFLKRNCGAAFEPGAFQVIPNMGIALLFCKEKRVDVKYVLILVLYMLAVITTKSTTGLIVMLLLIGVRELRKMNSANNVIRTILIAAIGLIFLWDSILKQLNKMLYTVGGISARFSNSIYALKNYGMYIWGIGSTRYKFLQAVTPQIGAYDVYVNYYMRFGLLFTIILIFMFFKLHRLNIYIFIVLFVTCLTESLLGLMTIPFLYYAVTHNNSESEQYSDIYRKQ